jgi:hypothetical protein
MDFRIRDVSAGGGGQVNIGSGNTNVGGDQIDNRGGTFAGRDLTVERPSLASDIEALGALLGQLRLTESERAEATRELDAFREASRTAGGKEPDREKAGSHLRRFTTLLRDAGALAGAGATLVEPLIRLGRWLGPIGASVLALL